MTFKGSQGKGHSYCGPECRLGVLYLGQLDLDMYMPLNPDCASQACYDAMAKYLTNGAPGLVYHIIPYMTL